MIHNGREVFATMQEKLPFNVSALTHAYLILAQPDAGYAAAYRLAQTMLCSAPDARTRPCGLCRDCRKAEKGIHPDIITVSRQLDDKGKQKREIYVDQIRSVAADAVVLPNEAEHKVYIIRDADTMNAAAQNALLKILEEPPRFVSFILVAASAIPLLETVRSRCVTLHRTGEDAAPNAEARELAERYIDYAAAGARISLLSFANANGDLGNREMTDFVAAVRSLLTDMFCKRLPDRKMPRAKLLRLVELMDTAEEYLRFNVSTKHVLGLLAVETVPTESNNIM